MDYSAAVAALYLRGAPRPADLPKRLWPKVVRTLREEAPSLGGVSGVLRRMGLWEAALLLDHNGLLSWAEKSVASDRCLTVLDREYPVRWISVLGAGAPPALWKRGPMPPAPFASVVGSRRPTREGREFAFQAGKAVAGGFSLVSGGAIGCDRAAEAGCRAAGGRAVVITPHGLRRGRHPHGTTLLSVCSPTEEFSTANAMERNTLIYAVSARCLVVESRIGEGGTWHGAKEALRRRSTTVFVRSQPPSLAANALQALGARSVGSPEEFLCIELPHQAQQALFGLC